MKFAYIKCITASFSCMLSSCFGQPEKKLKNSNSCVMAEDFPKFFYDFFLSRKETSFASGFPWYVTLENSFVCRVHPVNVRKRKI